MPGFKGTVILANGPASGSPPEGVRRNVSGDHRPALDDGALPDSDARQNQAMRPDENIIFDNDFLR